MGKPLLYVFDISNIIHRAFYAMEKNNLSTSSGFPTGAIYGTFNILTKFIVKFKPNNVLICYDAQTGDCVRKDIYPLYKSNRTQVNAVSAQELIIRRIISLLGMESVEAVGYEADDLIGTAVSEYSDDYDIVVVSGDKDLLQLVQDGVTVYDDMKDITYRRDEVFNKFGVEPHQVVDYLALVGDNADCIPGVKGIGKKGAAKLLADYGSIREIYENLDKITGATHKKLDAGRDDAYLSYNLASLRLVDIKSQGLDISFAPSLNRDLIDLFAKLEFNDSLLNLQRACRLYE